MNADLGACRCVSLAANTGASITDAHIALEPKAKAFREERIKVTHESRKQETPADGTTDDNKMPECGDRGRAIAASLLHAL
ncbi:hypothetical protein JJQ59_37230 (plasmid) [Cupriavidus necator]|uniref:hypothetical protein n=1 Tax=Cupriavidus necator TaxID=106590 RepID=UPI0011BDB687|nr:hypothetical protein [Cupriavidus necator]QQX89199.1 hypothetical protein JJQ59_37230 [Cupriavidus necator]